MVLDYCILRTCFHVLLTVALVAVIVSILAVITGVTTPIGVLALLVKIPAGILADSLADRGARNNLVILHTGRMSLCCPYLRQSHHHLPTNWWCRSE